MDNKQKKIVFLGVLLLGCVATSWLQQGLESKQAVPRPLVTKEATKEDTRNTAKERREKTIQVYVSGAVREPGIYTLPAGARAKEALEAAGGMRPDAKADRVNLAKKLKDGSHVYVPAVKSSENNEKTNKNRTIKDKAKTINTNENTKAEWGDFGNEGSSVNVNTATQAELMALPGVGEATANRIIALRRVRRLQKIEDLLQVRGIGQAKLERLRPYVRVE
ncbi:MAG: helix-hairpin-helix domain-containing protein [Phascolarctobacterium sp.]